MAEVFVNGTLVVRNEESYFPFSADITDALLPGENLLVVKAVNDVSCKHPWGKQKIKRGGMWYTPCSGIWQTVWLEPVPARFISALKITADESRVEVRIEGVETGSILFEDEVIPFSGGIARFRVSSPVSGARRIRISIAFPSAPAPIPSSPISPSAPSPSVR